MQGRGLPGRDKHMFSGVNLSDRNTFTGNTDKISMWIAKASFPFFHRVIRMQQTTKPSMKSPRSQRSWYLLNADLTVHFLMSVLSFEDLYLAPTGRPAILLSNR